MNKNLFRRVFSKRHGMLVAVSETVKSAGKRAGETRAPELTAEGRVVSTLTAIALALMAFDAVDVHAQALPTGGQVTAGQATISQPNTNTMNINQASQRAVLDWNTFNIGKGNTVQFNQPNAQAQALNRVTGAGASNINGNLLANGQVLIQNANGVLFGKNAVVNVGSLLATTKSIDSNSFMNGDPLLLKSTGKQAGVINEGDIQAQGYVTLMGDQVRNSGSIATAPGGQVVLAAGDSATVALPNGQGISLVLDHATANALVENTGHILSQDGTVLITARGKDTLLNTVVNLNGVVRAGTIVADAGSTGDVTVTGQLDASNMAAGGKGGTVVLSGDRVGLFGDASVDVSGDAAGGTAILGGDSLHMLDGTQAQSLLQDGMTFANHTQVDAGASLKANAVTGNGGFVETSGHYLDVQGGVSAASEQGKAGHWLIDPSNIVISTGNDAGYTGNVTDGFAAQGNAATVKNSSINDALNAGTDVTISTASAGTAKGDITQQAGADITKTAGGAANLSLIANGSISLSGNITSTSDKLNLNLTAAAGEQDRGSVVQTSTSTIDVNGGDLRVSGNTHGGTTSAVKMYGSLLNVGGGEITGTSTGATAVDLRGNLTQIGNGTFNITGTADGTGNRQGVSIMSNVSLLDGATMNVRGTAVQGPGVQLTSTMRVMDNATLNIDGTSSTSTGFWSNGKFEVEGNGVLNVTGRSETNTGIQGASLTMSGNTSANIIGTSVNGRGVQTTNLQVLDNATLNITGTSTNSSAVVLEGKLTQSGNSTLNITGTVDGTANIMAVLIRDASVLDRATMNVRGTAVAGTGVQMGPMRVLDNATLNIDAFSKNSTGTWAGRFEVAGNGVLNLTARSESGNSIQNANINARDNATVRLDGTSENGAGIAGAFISATDNATATFNGTSAGGGTGANVRTDLSGDANVTVHGTSVGASGFDTGGAVTQSVSGNATLNIFGDSVTGSGILSKDAFAVSDNGTVNLVGSSADGYGVWFERRETEVTPDTPLDLDISDRGQMTISGTSTNGSGVGVRGDIAAKVDDDAQLTIAGKSTDGDGIDQNGTLSVSGGGAVEISGTSVNGAGVDQHANSGIHLDGNGSLSIAGESDNGTGVSQGGEITLSDGASGSVEGTSTNGTGIAQTETGTIGIDGGGSLDVSGKSQQGTGMEQGGNIAVSDGGSARIEGESASGTGIAQTGNGSIDVSGTGSLDLSGKSADGTGVDQGGKISITDGGTSAIDGTSLNGTGVAQTGEGSINVEAGAQSSIAGTSKNGKGLADGIAVTGEGESTVADVAWPVEPVPPTPVDGGDQGGQGDTGTAGSGGSGSSDSTAAIAGAVGAVGLGGALAYFWDDLAGATWHLSAAQPLSVESGDAEYWAGAQIADVEVDPSSDVAIVQVKTATGESTMQLAFRDGADGVKHFFHEDAATKTQGTLSLNTQTREFFYVESGLKGGKPYTVKANGWLKPTRPEATAS